MNQAASTQAQTGLVIANYLIMAGAPAVCVIYVFRARKEEQLLWEQFLEYDQYAGKTGMSIQGCSECRTSR